ncbi:cAMP-binding domain of CRP or a regulatory subunit of cAMP-dependent protein kinases [Flexibacter flexilis DSM 6793]|uniref:cAMP-binding domain of CRP or a regulatory subunit of cAMP-dependent protein kinases n=1 Tax=Flexibacter flexilis DSM 6793 TaxID=927664 RepID=A0A1I1GFX8_9BACT|nr:Crp/Fnr family transcriptional regulator [Flexibacter flexilis]SFC08070.1 cAMP-binding domain of CRP or a regulatory subunit of cAMP-dependent protein kinases [Flexibacter flexilis DSM 6793]
MKSLFQQTIAAIHPLTPQDFEDFFGLFKSFESKRKHVLTSAGEAEKHLYFVVEGLQRLYYLDDSQREATLVFTYTGNFGGVLDAMLMHTPSRYYYETLTPSVFLRAPYSQVEALAQSRPEINTLIHKGLVGAFSGVLERLVELQCFSSEQKFRKLLQRSPHILQIVPHKYLADYIGIDASNFSKLLNSIKI